MEKVHFYEKTRTARALWPFTILLVNGILYTYSVHISRTIFS